MIVSRSLLPSKKSRNEPFDDGIRGVDRARSLVNDFPTPSQSGTEPAKTATSLADDEGKLGWLLRGALLLILIASPWPFGAATPLPSAFLSASLYVLFGIWVAFLLIKKADLAFSWPGYRWLVLAVALGLLQLLPLAPGLVGVLAPASARIHYPAGEGVEAVLGLDWQPVSIEPFATEAELLRIGALIAAFYLFGHLFVHRRDIRLLGYSLSLLGVALSLFAVYQQARWGALLYGRFPVASVNPFGPFVNHNHFAGFVEMCALVALGGSIGHLGRRTQTVSILMGGSALFMGVALVLSRSRGGFLAAAAGAVVLGVLALRGKARTRVSVLGIWVGAVALLILFAAPSNVIERIGSIGQGSQDVSMGFRMQLWTDSMRLALRSPVLGTGLGTYEVAIPPYRTDLDETRAEFAESDLVQMVCEAGAAGVILLGGFLLLVFRKSTNKLDDNSVASGSQGVIIGSMAAVSALLVHGLFDFNTHIPSNGLLFAGLLGMIASSHPREAPARHNITFRGIAAFLVVLVMVGAAARTLSIGYSRDALLGVDPPRADPEAFAELAARISASRGFAPQNPEGAFKLGVLYSEEAYRSPDARRYQEIRFGQARDAFDEAVRLAPAQGRYWFELAWTEANLANDERADPLFEHALQLEPASSRIRVNYALYLASRGRVDESLEQLERGRDLTPGISPYEAVSTIGPYVRDDPELLRRAAGDNPEAAGAIDRYVREVAASSK